MSQGREQATRIAGQSRGCGCGVVEGSRCRPNMAHKRPSRPGFSLGCHVEVVLTFHMVASSIGSGLRFEAARFVFGDVRGTGARDSDRLRALLRNPARPRGTNMSNAENGITQMV